MEAKVIEERRANTASARMAPPGFVLTCAGVVQALEDGDFEREKARLNTAIHELVWAVSHLEDNEFECAANALAAAQGSILETADLCRRRLEARGI